MSPERLPRAWKNTRLILAAVFVLGTAGCATQPAPRPAPAPASRPADTDYPAWTKAAGWLLVPFTGASHSVDF